MGIRSKLTRVSLERIPMLGLQHNMCVITVALAYSIAY